jgi:predicted nucleic acid-binding protein
VIHLDTSLLVDALTGKRLSFPTMLHECEQGDAFQLSSVTLYEWLRGPRTMKEITDQEELFPSQAILPFDEHSARIASMLYRAVRARVLAKRTSRLPPPRSNTTQDCGRSTLRTSPTFPACLSTNPAELFRFLRPLVPRISAH